MLCVSVAGSEAFKLLPLPCISAKSAYVYRPLSIDKAEQQPGVAYKGLSYKGTSNPSSPHVPRSSSLPIMHSSPVLPPHITSKQLDGTMTASDLFADLSHLVFLGSGAYGSVYEGQS